MFFNGATDHLMAQTSVGKDYILGAGDRLEIKVWDHDDLNRSVEVAQDGTFSFPFIGKILADGKSVYTLEKDLAKKLSDGYLIAPQITVGVTDYQNKMVYLFGEVIQPGSYILKKDMRLLELISVAGGFTERHGYECTVVRKIGSKKKPKIVEVNGNFEQNIITLNLSRLIAGDPNENILILPNDSVYISKVKHIFVTGEVRMPGEIEFTQGMTVRQALSMAGGVTPKAAIKRTIIIRIESGQEIVLKPRLSDTVNPNDILKVPVSYF
jgi:polysaccharide export outer membrane protein